MPPLASGLKTALWHLAQRKEILARGSVVADAASFQSAVIEVLVGKAVKAAREVRVGQILLSGGVAANKVLAERFVGSSPIAVMIPPPHLCTDNAAMVAGCGYYHFQTGQVTGYDLDVVPSLSLG